MGKQRSAAKAETAAAEWVDVGDLQPWEKNPRKNDAAVAEVAKSIEHFGFGAPILARQATRTIIAGHTRLRAAKTLGMTRVPVRFLDISEQDAELLALADNKLSEIAEWDDAQLAAVLDELKADGANLSVAGFTEKDLDALAASLDPGDPVQVDPTSQYLVLVTCKDEQDQAQILERLMADGLDVKAMMS